MSGREADPPKLDGLLSRLSQIEALSLAGSDRLDQISLQGLAQIPSLRVLDLRNTALVTDLREALATLRGVHLLAISKPNFAGGSSSLGHDWKHLRSLQSALHLDCRTNFPGFWTPDDSLAGQQQALDTVILKNSAFSGNSPADDALDEDRMGLFVSFYSEHVRSMKESGQYRYVDDDVREAQLSAVASNVNAAHGRVKLL
ncbi:hypothetical protein WJX73_002252 [Symbiochloris irregularis]|uniref:Leucine Rich repeats (2 copies) n=1 Tax=Symbiochloris irregularis TaxID=706552 RepID=A0AAW1P7L5_9CHLO